MLITNSLRKDPRVQREAETALKAGFDTYVLGCWDYNYDEEFLKKLSYKTWIYMIDQKYRNNLHSSILKFLRFVIPIYHLTKKCVEIKPEIIHANDLDTLPAAYIAAKLTKAKIIYDSHEIYTGMPQLVNRKIIKFVLQRIESFLIRRVDHVISVSHAAASRLSELYKIPEPSVVTNCSFSVNEKKLDLKNEAFEVVYQGIMRRNRGYEQFVMAANYIDDKINLILRGYGDIKDYLRDEVEEHQFKNVLFPEPVEISELIKVASQSHVGVVLTQPVSDNFKYTVSNKIFEYIQARIPVILSDVPEHRYLNEKYKIGIIIDSITPEKIAEAINKLYTDEELYNYFKRNVEIAAKHLTWENEGTKLISIYKSKL